MIDEPSIAGMTDRDLLVTLAAEVRIGNSNNKGALAEIKTTLGHLERRDDALDHRIKGLGQGQVAMVRVAEDVRALKGTVEQDDRQFVALDGSRKGAIGAWEIAKQIGLVNAGALALLGVQLAVQPKHQPPLERSRVTMEHVQPAPPIQHR